MKIPINNDNIYRKGTTIYARVSPDVKLYILDYKTRIYYCNVVGAEDDTVLTYFEHELMPDLQKLWQPEAIL